MYRQDGPGDTVPQFSQISITQPEDRISQQLRNHLLDMVTPKGSPEQPLYILDYRITESVGSVFVTRSDEITRNNLQLSVAAYLRDYKTGNPLTSFSVSSQASYNLTVADYANLISEKNARERALRDAAEQIRIRLANYFNRLHSRPLPQPRAS
ncbi:LPS assembly lipoprotein LptE [Ferrovibrio sp.]|uniref:LPS assembly lipoprotein LptE n=1 Tax=Ferrovibrio sp. TaxID=1917215 RepID=UPI00391BCF51